MGDLTPWNLFGGFAEEHLAVFYHTSATRTQGGMLHIGAHYICVEPATLTLLAMMAVHSNKHAAVRLSRQYLEIRAQLQELRLAAR